MRVLILLFSDLPFLDRVLERGEKIELLVDKTDRLNQSALKFERSVSQIL